MLFKVVYRVHKSTAFKVEPFSLLVVILYDLCGPFIYACMITVFCLRRIKFLFWFLSRFAPCYFSTERTSDISAAMFIDRAVTIKVSPI